MTFPSAHIEQKHPLNTGFRNSIFTWISTDWVEFLDEPPDWVCASIFPWISFGSDAICLSLVPTRSLADLVKCSNGPFWWTKYSPDISWTLLFAFLCRPLNPFFTCSCQSQSLLRWGRRYTWLSLTLQSRIQLSCWFPTVCDWVTRYLDPLFTCGDSSTLTDLMNLGSDLWMPSSLLSKCTLPVTSPTRRWSQ